MVKSKPMSLRKLTKMEVVLGTLNTFHDKQINMVFFIPGFLVSPESAQLSSS
jgi:hypothetical protein